MTKVFPDGRQEPFASEFANSVTNLGITGLASGPDGTVYVACLTSIFKVKTNGTFAPLANAIVVKECDEDAPTVFLRGLDVDSDGTVYAAACGCRCVMKITVDGRTETVSKAERPWSPTGVAVQGGDVYILEYTNANGAPGEGWLPRVRKLGRDGRVTVLVTISKEQQSAQPNRQIFK
jgi:sugar lactone lactonase YvrE